jgi:hypothetical protein
LICNAGFCGRPCSPGRSPACLEGSVCHHGNNEPACLPSCLQSGCSSGKQCIRISGDFSICATVHGQDCDKQPCSPGEECRHEVGFQWNEEEVVDMSCARPCSEKEGRLCPEGFICFNGYCARLCNEEIPGSCGAGERCARILTRTKKFAICLRQ